MPTEVKQVPPKPLLPRQQLQLLGASPNGKESLGVLSSSLSVFALLVWGHNENITWRNTGRLAGCQGVALATGRTWGGAETHTHSSCAQRPSHSSPAFPLRLRPLSWKPSTGNSNGYRAQIEKTCLWLRGDS